MGFGLDSFMFNLFNKKKFPDWLQLIGRASGAVRVYLKDTAGNIMLATGTAVPGAVAGYAKSALFIKTDAGAGVAGLYENIGTTASANFNLIGAISAGEITLADGKVLIGAATGVGAEKSISGDATLANTGELTIANAAISLAKMANLAAESVIVNPTAGAAVPQAVSIAEGRLLGRATGGHVDDIQITNEHVDNAAAIALSKMATQAANTVCANGTADDAVPTAIAISDNKVLGRSGGNLTEIEITNAHIAAGAAIEVSKINTTGALTPEMDQVYDPITEATDGNISLLVADLAKGYMVKTNCSAGRDVTVDTATNIQAATWFVATTGAHFDFTLANASGQTLTIVTADGCTLRGTVTIPTDTCAILRFINTGAGTVDVVIINRG
jgi:hypothetical protein